jgi:AraC-like DNA-binding protein
VSRGRRVKAWGHCESGEFFDWEESGRGVRGDCVESGSVYRGGAKGAEEEVDMWVKSGGRPVIAATFAFKLMRMKESEQDAPGTVWSRDAPATLDSGRVTKISETFSCRDRSVWLDGQALMRIVRPDESWCVLFPTRGERMCLQRLALRCGYRVNELCVELECHRDYLHEVFLRDIGLSPKVWMRWERMVVARRMLVGGESPDAVASSLGFALKNNFRREFLAFYGVPPLQLQRESWGEG